ncbi:ATP-grasp domain-containing protein [Cupriavidus basilensis]
MPTVVSRDAKRLREFHAEQGDVIFKPLDGMETVRASSRGAHGPCRPRGLAGYRVAHRQRRAHDPMAQRSTFLPAIREGDKRILLIGGSPVPHSLARVPMAGEESAAIWLCGWYPRQAQPLSERDQVIAHALAPVLWQRGLLLVGLDVIGDYLTEVNVTSPTCCREIHSADGLQCGRNVHRCTGARRGREQRIGAQACLQWRHGPSAEGPPQRGRSGTRPLNCAFKWP